MADRDGNRTDGVERVAALLEQVLAVAPEAQAARLDELCALHPPFSALLRQGFASLARLDLLGIGQTKAGASPPAAGEPPSGLPRTLGPFRLLELLGAGGMGAVYRAEDTELGRQVALKLVRAEMLTSERARTRFQREAAALARLDHPGLCTVYRAGTTDGQPWIAMRLVTGTTLRQQIDARRKAADDAGSSATPRSSQVHREVRHVLQMFEKIARALAAAHAVGLVHRDLKPGNLVLAGDDEPVVIDFGLVHFADSDSHLTVTGDPIGTPAYMAPEQVAATGHEPTATTDVYALGVTLFEALTLQSPYAAPSREELFTCIVRGKRRRLRQVRRDLPAELELVLEKALDLEPARRYASMRELAEDLRRFVAHEPLLAAPPSAWYRLQKLVRRYPAQVLGSGAVFVTAVVGALVALQFAMRLQTTVSEFDLLSGVVLHEQVLTTEKDLDPPWPHQIEAMEGWLREASRLLAMRDGIQRTVAALRARALPRDEEDRRRDRATHPQQAAWLAATREVAALQHAQRLRESGVPVSPELSAEYRGMTLKEMYWAAWERVVPPPFREDTGRTVFGEELLGLQLARTALARSDHGDRSVTRCTVLRELALACLANGQDDDALDAAEQAIDVAQGEHRKTHETDKERLLQAIEGAATRLQSATRKVAELSAKVDERRTWRFAPDEDSARFLHHTLVELLGKLGALESEQKVAVARRLHWAKQVQSLSLAHPRARVSWTQAREAIAKADGVVANTLYAGTRIELRDEHVMGLVPIGMNPVTRLWEFYDLRSASDGEQDAREIEIPVHAPDGSIPVKDVTGIVFVLLPGGKATMGSSPDPDSPWFDAQRAEGETLHTADLPPFFLARHEMTKGQWQRLASGEERGWYRAGVAYGGNPEPIGNSHPVEQVDWDACARLLARHGMVLPTEAQWEYGCRAGTTSPWWPGQQAADLAGCANVFDRWAERHEPGWGRQQGDFEDGRVGHGPVGSYRANAFGLYDVHGNVWEWCADLVGAIGKARPGEESLPRSKDGSSGRVNRGGGFTSAASDARCANRNITASTFTAIGLGLRPARLLQPGIDRHSPVR